MQDGALEVVGKEQVAATSDMEDRTGKFCKLHIDKIRHRIIFHETACLHLHTEGVHLGEVLIMFCLYHISVPRSNRG